MILIVRLLSSIRRRASTQVQYRRARRVLGAEQGAKLGAGSRVNIAGGKLSVGRGVVIEHAAQIAVFGTLEIGDGVTIGDHFHCNATESVRVGAGSQLSWRVTIMDSDFHTITELDGTAGSMRAAVSIGKHALIGAGATILKGVTVGDGAIIGAGAVVTRDVRPGWIAVGNPAREVREVAAWI